MDGCFVDMRLPAVPTTLSWADVGLARWADGCRLCKRFVARPATPASCSRASSADDVGELIGITTLHFRSVTRVGLENGGLNLRRSTAQRASPMSAHDNVVGLCTSEPPPLVPINSRFRSQWRLTCFVDMPLPGRTHDDVVGLCTSDWKSR